MHLVRRPASSPASLTHPDLLAPLSDVNISTCVVLKKMFCLLSLNGVETSASDKNFAACKFVVKLFSKHSIGAQH